jgi:hypothetical protein
MLLYSLISCLHSQALALSEKQCEKRAAKSVQAAKSVELEALMKSQAEKIAELLGKSLYCLKLMRQRGFSSIDRPIFLMLASKFLQRPQQIG